MIDCDSRDITKIEANPFLGTGYKRSVKGRNRSKARTEPECERDDKAVRIGVEVSIKVQL